MKTINPINQQFTEFNICFYVVSTNEVNKKENIMNTTEQVYIGYAGHNIDPILDLKDEGGDSELFLSSDIKEDFNCDNLKLNLDDLEGSRLEFTPLNFKGSKLVKKNGTDFKNEDLAEILNNIYENKNIGDF